MKKKGLLFGLAALALSVVVVSLGGKDKATVKQSTNRPYWE